VVTGATGRQGGAVTRRLLADGWTVRGLTRNARSKKARRLAESGAEVVHGDMGDPPSLDRACAGAYGVYSVQNPFISGFDAEVTQGRNVADAARRAGVEHFVYGSAGTGRPNTGVLQWDNKLEVEAHARGLGLPLTVLRPMAFMELMTDKDFYPSVSTWHIMPKLMGWDRPVVWVAVDDLAAIAATAFSRADEYVGRELAIASDRRTLRECRSLWQEVRGRNPRGLAMPLPVFERFVGKDLPRMWRWLRDDPFDADVEGLREMFPGMLTVREWLEKQAA
jgi:uncharacterized protein YbjT (DUF2867 family)